MDTITDEDAALMQHIETSSKYDLHDEITALRNGLHDCKTVCNNAAIRLPEAINAIEKAMTRLDMIDKPHDVTGPLVKAFEAITLTLHDMKTNVEPMPISESQVIKYMKTYVRKNNLDRMSIQFDRGTKERREGNLGFYCNSRAHSGYSSHSTEEAKGRLDLELSRLGAKV